MTKMNAVIAKTRKDRLRMEAAGGDAGSNMDRLWIVGSVTASNPDRLIFRSIPHAKIEWPQLATGALLALTHCLKHMKRLHQLSQTVVPAFGTRSKQKAT